MARSTPTADVWGRIRDRRGLIARPVFRQVAAIIAEEFEPERIILFGSYAYGQPNPDSDVDVLVVMPARNEIDQSIRIWNALDPPFPLDVIVRTPKNFCWQLDEGDWFLQEVTERGKVLYEKADGAMGTQGRSRQPSRLASECVHLNK
jgi:predicted nucleotidyltransferase